MPIILNEEQESFKYDLLKQSLKEEVNYRLNKNHSFSNQKDSYSFRQKASKLYQESFSDWGDNSVENFNNKKRSLPFVLPLMKQKRKSQSIEDLSRQLMKYEQFNIDQIDDKNKFRLSFLKQMTKINFKKAKNKKQIKQTGSPNKVNIKLQFPDRYEKFKQQNNEKIDQIVKQQQFDVAVHSSFYSKRPTRGLIPSIKKLVSASFPKKSMFRSQSQRDPYQQTKLLLNRNEWEGGKKNFTDQIQDKFIQKQKSQRQRKVRLARLQRKLPLNFLSYSHRKTHQQNDGEKQEKQHEQLRERKVRKQKSPYYNISPKSSYYPKIQRMNDGILYEHQKLSQCILLGGNKKITETKQQ